MTKVTINKKVPVLQNQTAKAVAIQDISQECGRGRMYERNYIFLSRSIRLMNRVER